MNKAPRFIAIEQTLVATDILEKYFICDVQKCKGACCVEGEAGAPLEKDETQQIAHLMPHLRSMLSPEALAVIDKKGMWIEEDGKYSTPLVDDGICVYGIRDAQGIVQCAFQQYHKAKGGNFPKPISCHLYPIRITKTSVHDLLNYERIPICNKGCKLGAKKSMPLFVFLKEALIRKYGAAYFRLLEAARKRFFG